MRLLLVEDDEMLGDGVRLGLEQEGYTVDWLRNAEQAQAALTTDHFELMVLDLGLPGKGGMELLQELRSRGIDLPVLILTARDAVTDKVKALDSGADDYLVKPFDLAELSARLRVLQRRRGGRAISEIVHGSLRLDPAGHQVSLAGNKVELSPREFNVLQLLLEQRGRVLSRQRLEESLYSWDSEVESNAVEVYIHHLRKKLGADLIRTIRGVGYIIDKDQ